MSHNSKTARYVAAKELHDTILRKLIQGFDPFSKNTVRVTINVALTDLVKVKQATLRKRTGSTYSSIACLFCEWLRVNGFEHLMPHQLTLRIVQAYFDECVVKEKVSARTHNNRLRTLRTLFHVLTKREFLEYNVFTKVDLLPEEESTLSAYTPAEKILIRDELENSFPELWLSALFVYYCLIRPQELVRLQFSDIDFENKSLMIPGTKSKNKKTGTILIPDPLHDVLLRMGYDQCPKAWYIFSNGRKLTPGEKEISPNRIFNEWQQHVQNALNIKKTIYLFKHTGAGELFDDGADPRNIQLQIRHKSLEETLIYLEKYRKRPNENLRKHFKPI
jgi:integrase